MKSQCFYGSFLFILQELKELHLAYSAFKTISDYAQKIKNQNKITKEAQATKTFRQHQKRDAPKVIFVPLNVNVIL